MFKMKMVTKEGKRLALVFRRRFSAKGLWLPRQRPPFPAKKPTPCLEMDAGFRIHTPFQTREAWSFPTIPYRLFPLDLLPLGKIDRSFIINYYYYDITFPESLVS